MVDENLVFHEEWELGACVDEGLLDARTEQVDLVPFTYQQLDVFKRTLDKVAWDWPCLPASRPSCGHPSGPERLQPSRSLPWAVLPTGVPRVPDLVPEVLPPLSPPWSSTSGM